MQRRAWLKTLPAWLAWREVSGQVPGHSEAAAAAMATAPASAPVVPIVSPTQALSFPKDFGAHPDHTTEWWYITGALHSGARPWGFQITFFRTRIKSTQDNPSAFAARQVVMAHAAITDLQGGRLVHEQRLARTGFGLTEATQGDTKVHLRDWQLVRQGPVDQSRYHAQINGQAFGLALHLKQTQPTLLQGLAGYSRKGPLPEQASHYYSQPQLQVEGQLRWQNQTLAVQGRAWMDHEWSESLLAPDVVGWDWIGMNLFDGSTLMAFRVRRKDGSAVWAGGSHRAPGQAPRPFEPQEVRFTPGRRWQSPATGAHYPVEWMVETPVGRFSVRTRMDAQELANPQRVGNIYWEGLCELISAQGTRVGEGYLEMTGYVAPVVL
jgi:predicted secreted hydrolase